MIYNGRTPELFNRLCRKRQYAASAGRLWDEGKQSRLLIELAHPPMPILVAGALALEDEVEPDLLEAGEMERGGPPRQSLVRCSGVLSEQGMREMLARAAIYIATSKYEPFGLAPLEAALSGCALVANDIPSLREIWGESAMYFRKDNSRSLAEVLAQLHADPKLCSDYAERAYAHACRNYSASRMVEEYLQAYQAVLAQGVAAA